MRYYHLPVHMFEIRYEYMITREFADSVHLQRRPRDVSLLRCDDNFRRGVHRLIANSEWRRRRRHTNRKYLTGRSIVRQIPPRRAVTRRPLSVLHYCY